MAQPDIMAFESEVNVIDESKQGQAFSPGVVDQNDSSKKFYIESYGCQMNFSDSEIVASILMGEGFCPAPVFSDADIILINTCAIRDNAEQRVRNRLKEFNVIKKGKPDSIIGVLGCMAERLKSKLLEEEKLVDMVIGPDAYRDLPNLIKEADGGQKSVNVLLSREETYADLSPVRLNSNGVTAFISIMRGCDNMCSFCVVPFTRGRERSRDPETIIAEATQLFENGYREVTLLGQNVDSFLWFGGGPKKDFNLLSEEQKANSVNFASLLEKVASIHPELRVRFSTSNPGDMTDEVLHTIAKHGNICNYIHLPVQSGSSAVLERMNRGYNREWYKERIKSIRNIIPDCGISTDIITGFCGETEADHQDTLSLMEWVGYDMAYMFYYSERPGTLAERKFHDDVPQQIKKRRLQDVIKLQQRMSTQSNRRDIEKTYRVLVEGTSKKSDEYLFGRNTQNKVIVFPKEQHKPGDYVHVKVTGCTSATLIGISV